MFWGKGKEEPPPEPQEPVKRAKLNPHLQRIVDHDDHFYDDVYSP